MTLTCAAIDQGRRYREIPMSAIPTAENRGNALPAPVETPILI